MSNYNDSNRNARIMSRIDRKGKVRTETVQRDTNAETMAVSFDRRNNATKVFIDSTFGYNDVVLNGHQARTLYRLLSKHYEATDGFRVR